MADETAKPPVDVPPQIPANLGPFVLSPLNHAIAAGAREAFKLGVPVHNVLEMMVNQLASVIALVEPAGVRANALADVQRQLPDLMRQYVEAKHLTPGGIYMPGRAA